MHPKVLDFVNDRGGQLFVWVEGRHATWGLVCASTERPYGDIPFAQMPSSQLVLWLDPRIDEEWLELTVAGFLRRRIDVNFPERELAWRD